MHSRGVCVVKGTCMAKGGMHGKGEVCMAKGDMCGEGGHACQRGVGGTWQERQPLQQAIWILLECIFVFVSQFKLKILIKALTSPSLKVS